MAEHVWSYSSLDCFEQCPRKFYHKYVLREKEPPTAKLLRGREIHSNIEQYLKGNAPQKPELIEKFMPLVSAVTRRKKDIKMWIEQKFGVNRKLESCDFFAPDVWGRGAADVLLVDYPNAFLGDWKDGKGDKPWSYVLKYEKPTQLAILALFIFNGFPRVEKVTGCNVWLEHGRLGPVSTFTRAMAPTIWAAIIAKVQAIEAATQKNLWKEMPGPLCAYCPVKICKFNRS